MKICIKNPAPLGPNLTRWGDYHFGRSLQEAFERRGHSVRQSYWPQWDEDGDEDVVIVLRGKRRHQPRPGRINLMWVMSHPGTVSAAEMDQYDLVYVASETLKEMVDDATHVPVEVMRQCTDSKLFAPPEDADLGVAARRDFIFVANSRGLKRDMVRWSISESLPLKLYGRHWGALGLSKLVVREYVENHELPELYRRSRVSLNDHWGDMAHFGIINNRIFDCLACGLPVLSDSFPELERVCGDAVLVANSPSEFADAVRRAMLRYPEVIERTRQLWERISTSFSFDARAEQILAQVEKLPPRKGVVTRDELTVPAGLAEVMELLPRLSSSEVQLFHAFPSRATGQVLSGMDGIGYLSGGLGRGPWHVDVAEATDQIRDEAFDVIILEPMAAGQDQAQASQAEEVVRKLVSKLKHSGLLLQFGEGERDWSALLEQAGLVRKADSGFPVPGWERAAA